MTPHPDSNCDASGPEATSVHFLRLCFISFRPRGGSKDLRGFSSALLTETLLHGRDELEIMTSND